jgi:hypothetical protein
MTATRNGAQHGPMPRGHYVYTYEAEPADERPTDYASGFGQSGISLLPTTTSAAWDTTQHSTFEEPSHSIDRARLRRDAQRATARIKAWGFALVAVASCATLFAVAH